MPTREALLQDALLLSPGDRALLVDALEESLNHGEFATPEIAAAWSEEIDRRLAAYQRGETKALTVDQALDHIRHSLDECRAGQKTP
ncbi:MAG: addiction module protein [Planctomycetota bacterium]